MNALETIIADFASELGIPEVALVGSLILFIIFLAFVIIVFMGFFMPLLSIATCAAPNARVRAIGNPMIRCEILRDIAESGSLRDAAEKSRQYCPWIDPTRESAEAFERQLWEQYIRDMRDLHTLVPDGIKSFFQACSLRCEINMLMGAIRMKVDGRPPDEIRDRVEPVVALTPELVDAMAEAADVEQLVLELAHTPYGPVLADGLAEYAEEGVVEPFERRLYRFAFDRLTASRLVVGSFHTAEVGAYIDCVSSVHNLRTILRGIADGQGKEEIRAALLPPSPSLPEPLLGRMVESSGVLMIADLVRDTPFGPVLDESLQEYAQSGSLVSCEHALDEYVLEIAFNLDVVYSHSAGPLIRYLVAREFETRNLRALFWGVEAQAPDRLSGTVCREGGAS